MLVHKKDLGKYLIKANIDSDLPNWEDWMQGRVWAHMAQFANLGTNFVFSSVLLFIPAALQKTEKNLQCPSTRNHIDLFSLVVGFFIASR